MVAIRRLQKNASSLNVTIPAEIRDALDLHFGDSLAFILQEHGWASFTKIDLEKRPDMRAFSFEGLPKINYDK